MLKSVAADYHKKGLMVLHFVNASPQVAKLISAALPSADIAFLSEVKIISFDSIAYQSSTIPNLLKILQSDENEVTDVV